MVPLKDSRQFTEHVLVVSYVFNNTACKQHITSTIKNFIPSTKHNGITYKVYEVYETKLPLK